MNIQDAINTILKREGVTQKELALKVGFKNQSGVSTMLSRGNVTLANVLKLLDALGYQIEIHKKTNYNDIILDSTVVGKQDKEAES